MRAFPGGIFWGLVVSALLCLPIAAMTLGSYEVSLSQIVQILWDAVQGREPEDAQAATVVLSIRLPRVGAALLIGAALAAAGAVFQGVFRNPLVSPDILGVSSGAAFGAVLAIFLSLPMPAVQGMAFVGGLGAVFLVMLLASWVRRQEVTLVLVLAGVIVGALAGAITSLLKILADPYDQLPAITFWLLGSLSAVMTQDMLLLMPVLLVALIPLLLLRWRIDILAMGDEEARALGVDAGRLRVYLIVCATLLTAAVVAVAGVVGWLGLVVPHMARLVVGPGFARLLPASLILGALFLLIVDSVARSLSVHEIPLGVLMALLGGPVFVWLLAHGRRSWA